MNISFTISLYCKIFFCLFTGIVLPRNCFTQNVKIIQATSQHWTAGVRGGGGGINYEVQIVAPASSAKMKFSRVWLGEKSFPLIYVVKKGQKTYKGKGTEDFAKNDTVVMKFNDFQKGERLPEDHGNIQGTMPVDSIQPPPPVKFTGEALIAYTLGKKKKNFVVEKFEVLPRLNYP